MLSGPRGRGSSAEAAEGGGSEELTTGAPTETTDVPKTSAQLTWKSSGFNSVAFRRIHFRAPSYVTGWDHVSSMPEGPMPGPKEGFLDRALFFTALRKAVLKAGKGTRDVFSWNTCQFCEVAALSDMVGIATRSAGW